MNPLTVLKDVHTSIGYQVASTNAVQLRNILRRENLDWFLNYVENNNKGQNNKYHNTNHCIAVALRCHELAAHHVGTTLSTMDYRELMIAALFHDFDYTVGFSEADNHHAAISGMRQAAKDYYTILDERQVRPLRLANIDRHIRATEFPFKEEDPCYVGKFLRDADVMAITSPDYVYVIMFGLREELGMTVDDFVGAQLQFMSTVRIFNEEARDLWHASMPHAALTFNSFKNMNKELK